MSRVFSWFTWNRCKATTVIAAVAAKVFLISFVKISGLDECPPKERRASSGWPTSTECAENRSLRPSIFKVLNRRSDVAPAITLRIAGVRGNPSARGPAHLLLPRALGPTRLGRVRRLRPRHRLLHPPPEQRRPGLADAAAGLRQTGGRLVRQDDRHLRHHRHPLWKNYVPGARRLADRRGRGPGVRYPLQPRAGRRRAWGSGKLSPSRAAPGRR